MSRHCPTCGENNLRHIARFCDCCGAKLAAGLANRTIRPLPEATNDEATKPMPQAKIIDNEAIRPRVKTKDDDEATKLIPQARTLDDDEATRPIPETELIDDEGPKKAVSAVRLAADETDPPRDSDFKPGAILKNRYRLTKILGKGGFGAAYLAEDVKLKRRCVVKQMLTKKKSTKALEIYRANFEREAKLLVQLNDPGHPNIPEIYDYFFDDSGNYLVMKYIEGRNLKEILDQDETLPPSQDVIRYGVDLCSALHYMHNRGQEPVMHRDIKPANILLGDDDRIWLIDFGLAKAQPIEDSDETDVTKAGGSMGYTPLEQWLGEATPASDIYALGATLHHLFSGLNPVEAFGGQFHIQKLQQMHGQFIPIRKVNKQLPKAMEGIVASATSADPEQRPTALQLQQQFEVFTSGGKDTPLFTFKSGESAQTNGQLVDLCDQHHREAQGYLYRGDFKRWLELTNRPNLAEAAAQAIKQGKTQKDGLEKFLKLILPNLFFRRLGRAGRRVAGLLFQFGLIALLIILLLLLGSSYIARWVVQRSISHYPWDFYVLEVGQVNRYTETELDEIAQTKTEGFLNDILVDVRPPNHIDLDARWSIFLFELPLTVELVNQKPHFQLAEVGFPLYFITDNIFRGLNYGLDEAFRQAPVDITSLEITDTAVAFKVEESGRTPWAPPPTTPPTDARQPTATPSLDGTTLLAVFNKLDQAVILEIEGQSWTIAANDSQIIEMRSGAYHYTVRTVDEQLASQGQKTWKRSTYRVYIDLDIDQNIDIIDKD